ncbi:hypothetical protein MVEN_01964800 [Mycena venus]|uniref:Uncharacterized protein n=1 Tax=Mycena venus TaxID=2733690 RepID=A0A8H6XH46_9AGAR|nr:hypothetical protein MVEN_01964800 [Mycena venus]
MGASTGILVSAHRPQIPYDFAAMYLRLAQDGAGCAIAFGWIKSGWSSRQTPSSAQTDTFRISKMQPVLTALRISKIAVPSGVRRGVMGIPRRYGGAAGMPRSVTSGPGVFGGTGTRLGAAAETGGSIQAATNPGTAGNPGPGGSAFSTAGNPGPGGSAITPAGNPGPGGSAFSTAGNPGPGGSAFETAGNPGPGGSAFETAGNPGPGGSAFATPTNGNAAMASGKLGGIGSV